MKIHFTFTGLLLIFLILTSNVNANKPEYFFEAKKLYEKEDFEIYVEDGGEPSEHIYYHILQIENYFGSSSVEESQDELEAA